MIVPRLRLLWLVGVLVLPAATISALMPATQVWLAATLGALSVVCAADCLLAWRGLHGIRIVAPELVRWSKDREGSIDLLVSSDAARSKRLRLGLAFPREFVSPQEDLWTVLPERGQTYRISWTSTVARRGSYLLDRCYLETPSPLGLWGRRGSRDIRCEIRVYPNLLRDAKKVAALFLNRGGLGLHAQRQVGRGREFEKLREYAPGDDYGDIHWKTTAKRGRPVTKVFQVERTQEVYLVVDASRLTARTAGPDRDTILERFVNAALLLGAAAQRQGDLFGLVTFSDRIHGFVRARNGTAHYSSCRDALYALQPRLVAPDYDELSTFLRLKLRRRALLVFLTELDDPVLAESFRRDVSLLGRQHLILVGMVSPPGAGPLFSEDQVRTLDDIYGRLGGHMRWRKLRELEQSLRREGVRLSLLDAENLAPGLTSLYLSVKQRQLL